MGDVLLVDGVGRPKILAIPDALVSPTVIKYPHPQRAEGEDQVLVKFVRQPIEHDMDGREIYRQMGTGVPDVRVAYLVRSPITSPPKLRLEEP